MTLRIKMQRVTGLKTFQKSFPQSLLKVFALRRRYINPANSIPRANWQRQCEAIFAAQGIENLDYEWLDAVLN